MSTVSSGTGSQLGDVGQYLGTVLVVTSGDRALTASGVRGQVCCQPACSVAHPRPPDYPKCRQCWLLRNPVDTFLFLSLGSHGLKCYIFCILCVIISIDVPVVHLCSARDCLSWFRGHHPSSRQWLPCSWYDRTFRVRLYFQSQTSTQPPLLRGPLDLFSVNCSLETPAQGQMMLLSLSHRSEDKLE